MQDMKQYLARWLSSTRQQLASPKNRSLEMIYEDESTISVHRYITEILLGDMRSHYAINLRKNSHLVMCDRTLL